jgi:hypothetical protein
MNTAFKTQTLHAGSKSVAKTQAKTSAFWQSMEYNRYGLTPIIIIAVICLGSVAAGVANTTMDAAKIVTVSMAAVLTLTSILAVLPMKVIAYLSALSILIDLAVILL